MLIGGLQKTTLIDYPGKVAATVFTAGCNFFCGFCHNPELVLVQKNESFIADGTSDISRISRVMSEEQFFWWLEKRIGLLEGVCITGGEPTIHSDLPDFIKKIKELDFLVKLDTNGTNPDMLESLIADNIVDYLAMDIKAPLRKYPQFYKQMIDTENIERSVDSVKKFPKHEFRTTIIPTIHTKSDLLEIGKWLNGANKYVLQQFRPEKTLDPSCKNIEPYPEKELRNFCEMLKTYFGRCELRI